MVGVCVFTAARGWKSLHTARSFGGCVTLTYFRPKGKHIHMFNAHVQLQITQRSSTSDQRQTTQTQGGSVVSGSLLLNLQPPFPLCVRPFTLYVVVSCSFKKRRPDQVFMFDCASVSDLAWRTNEATHVLHHSDDWQLDLLTEPDLLPHILQSYLLEREKERGRKRRSERERGGNENRKTGRKMQKKKSQRDKTKATQWRERKRKDWRELFSLPSKPLSWYSWEKQLAPWGGRSKLPPTHTWKKNSWY